MNDRSTVLIAGGAGYIGSHANKELSRRGVKTVVFDNLSYGHREFARWGDFEQGDLNDADTLCRVFEKYRIGAVMHFSAFTYVNESVTDPARYYENNVVNTLKLLKAMNEHDVPNFIFSSTCATYGDPVKIPIPEEHPLNPINPYGRSKLMVEQMLADFSSAYGLRYVSLRYFNAAGADPDGEIGEWHEPETHLVPLVLDTALGVRDRVDIYGTDYDTADGTCIRDYIHVSDLATAHIAALDYLRGGGKPGVFNLGNGEGFSVRAIIDAAARVTGRKIPVREAARRAGDPPVLIGDASRAAQVLGWRPVHADIDVILETAWRWHTKLYDTYKTKR
ncbi:MAG TPA: UDP-glucose 4-epimerase GalE [Spirochaetota bacterium]|nr:UDP-glucose 4-epimerase GalE [Spirochaetota bacterium]HPG51805.1 UDP-glucose 4-epimerase GalE [Spirochaetota bacterium]HPN13456.1 UDP-glucose 4-epimerase GalE [Spirochaetota bacterium]